MKRTALAVAALALLAGNVGAQGIEYRPPGGGGTATAVSPGITTVTGCTNQALIGDGSSLVNCDTTTARAALIRKQQVWFTDMNGGGAGVAHGTFPFNVSLLASGTISNPGADANHPGLYKFTSSTSANSGAAVWTLNEAIVFDGDEHFEVIFQQHRFNADTIVTMGFGDSISVSANVDGAWLAIGSSGLITGVTSSNSSPTSTSTDFQLVLDTFYRGVVHVNASAASVTFSLYADGADGALLWTSNVTGTIPTGASRATGLSIRTYCTGSGSALGLTTLDSIYASLGGLNR